MTIPGVASSTVDPYAPHPRQPVRPKTSTDLLTNLHDPDTSGLRSASTSVDARRSKERPAGHVRVPVDIPASMYDQLVLAAQEHSWGLADVIRGALSQTLGHEAQMATVARLAAADTAARACRDRDTLRAARWAAEGTQGRPVARTRPVGYVRVVPDVSGRQHAALVAECVARPPLTKADVVRGSLTLTLGSKTAMAGVERYLQERARSLFTK